MRAPQFWRRDEASIEARLLAPISFAWGEIAGWRMARAGWRPPVPTLCVGNFVAGGAGKTPVAIRVSELMRLAGYEPAIVSRGYGGCLSGKSPIAVDLGRHGAADVGDEALLLARTAPCFVGANRRAACALACERGAETIVLDDGFQSAAIEADAALVVLDGRYGVGNGRVLPAGPLRAPLSKQWRRVSALLVLGEGQAGEHMAGEAQRRGTAIFRGALKPDPSAAQRLAGRRLVAFAGIGRPEKFYESLAALGADVRAIRSYPDHYKYRQRDLEELARLARSESVDCLVTTEKDLVRITGFGGHGAGRAPILALPVSVELADERAFVDWLSRVCRSRGRQPI